MQLVTKRLLLREFEGDDWLALTTFRADPPVSYTHLDVYKRQV